MRRVLIISALLFASASADAQLKGFSFGPYAERAWPAGNFEKEYNNGIGAGVGADIKLPGKLGLTGSVGLMRFSGKSINKNGIQDNIPALTATPLRVGLKYRLPLLYLKLESGTARMNDGNGPGWILSPGAGIRVLGLDVQVKYESWIRSETNSFWGLKASYNF